MNVISNIGKFDEAQFSIDRRTVKVVIKKDNAVLLLNDGLLPGGGLDSKESDKDAITRELRKTGVTVKNVKRLVP
ncbi:MAG: hypothetical protein R3B38_00550 [Patescibacteria group bacterium]